MRNDVVVLALLLATPQNIVAQVAENLLFTDDFDGHEIADGWSWLREAPAGWKLSDGELRLRTNGNLWEETNTQANLLLRPMPAGSEVSHAVEVTVSNRSDLTERYEHGGLIWYLDDDNWVTLTQLNHVQDKTQKIMLVHETEGDGRAADSHAVPFTESRVRLRLVIEGRRFTGYYRRATTSQWQRLGSITSAMAGGAPRIGLTAGQGPDNVKHWFIFDDFKLVELD